VGALVRALKFVLGAGVGLGFGVVVAALLTPRAGEDLRAWLLELIRDPGARFRLALAEAKEEQAARKRELKAQFEVAQRTGVNPE